MYPTAQRLLAHCDAVLRLPGVSTGADQDVTTAQERGLPVYHQLQDVPRLPAGTHHHMTSQPDNAADPAATADQPL